MTEGDTVAGQAMDRVWAVAGEWLLTEGLKVVFAFVILIFSFLVINLVVPWTAKSFAKRKKADKTIIKTVAYVAKIVLKLAVVVALVGYLGLDTSGVAALITSLGVAIGLAIQGAFSNFAGGLLLLITRPFGVDDYIEACGESGTVTDIRIVYTLLQTPDNKVISLPNGAVANSTIINYSKKHTRRVDLTLNLSADSDFTKARELSLSAFRQHPLVLKDPEPTAYLREQRENGVQMTARCWVKTEDYWTVYYDAMEQIHQAFFENGIKIPYQRVSLGENETNRRSY